MLMVPRFRDQEQMPAQICHEMEIKRFRIACGEFIGVSDVDREELEKPGVALVPKGFRYDEGMFAAHARGNSMEPKIAHGTWCLFHTDVVGTRQDRIVLVEDRGETGGERYTLKKYHSLKRYFQDGTWDHEGILLLSLNSQHAPIRLKEDGCYNICGWYVGNVPQIQRVEQPRYQVVPEDE
jgi:phage repressor protein C with HTH and peptisase S24 domain